MGIYNFQQRFVPFIESGAKTHTIRATRRYPDTPGNTLHLYTGLRGHGARLILRATCIEAQSIQITDRQKIFIDGVKLSSDECETLARLDGFENFADMMAFWSGRRPFIGQIIHWSSAQQSSISNAPSSPTDRAAGDREKGVCRSVGRYPRRVGL